MFDMIFCQPNKNLFEGEESHVQKLQRFIITISVIKCNNNINCNIYIYKLLYGFSLFEGNIVLKIPI